MHDADDGVRREERIALVYDILGIRAVRTVIAQKEDLVFPDPDFRKVGRPALGVRLVERGIFAPRALAVDDALLALDIVPLGCNEPLDDDRRRKDGAPARVKGVRRRRIEDDDLAAVGVVAAHGIHDVAPAVIEPDALAAVEGIEHGIALDLDDEKAACAHDVKDKNEQNDAKEHPQKYVRRNIRDSMTELSPVHSRKHLPRQQHEN